VARDREIFVTSSTNGHYLSERIARETVESGLNQIIISVDGADQQAYESYRRSGQLHQVLDGISNLIHARRFLKKRTPQIVMQTLLLSSTEHQLNEIKTIGKKLGVDKVVFKTAQFYNLNVKPSLMPDEQRYSRYISKANGHYQVKFRRSDSCFRMWSSCVITWDGWVVPCCFDKDADHAFGHLREHSFRDIWFGKKATEFRQQILTDRTSIPICNNCTQKF
jgi:radical SAM protein with 4Fe4S-binding SPASM domain